MLTRIEIDGFKSFEGFELTLPPFAVILGPNAAGKSNLFDALRFLSQLAVTDVRSAMRELRGEPRELFRHLPARGPVDRLKIAVEALLPRRVHDVYGQEIELQCTRVRYEVVVRRRDVSGIERFFIAEERAIAIKRGEDRWAPAGRKPSEKFRKLFMKYSTRGSPFLVTVLADGSATFEMHQDGKQGRVRKLPAGNAEATALSTVTVANEFLHLYALREELRSLRYLQLDPAAERQPSPLDAPEQLERDGSNLAAVLYRIQRETSMPDRPRGSLEDVRLDLGELIPGVVDLQIARDDERHEYRLRLVMRDGQHFSSRVVSDGTLRVLALLALLHDPKHKGTLLFEEPENGINKRRLAALMHYLKDACPTVDDPDPDEMDPLLQIIVNTHSPVAAAAVRDEIIIADIVEVVGKGRLPSHLCTRMRSHRVADMGELDRERRVTEAEIDSLLETIERSELAA